MVGASGATSVVPVGATRMSVVRRSSRSASSSAQRTRAPCRQSQSFRLNVTKRPMLMDAMSTTEPISPLVLAKPG